MCARCTRQRWLRLWAAVVSAWASRLAVAEDQSVGSRWDRVKCMCRLIERARGMLKT
jgi:hypothetical protein